MSSWAIVTGAGSGIGAALSHRLLVGGVNVLAVGRRQSALQHTVERAPPQTYNAQLVTLAVDIATTSGQEAVKAAIPPGEELRFLIHNAAVGDPSPLGHMDVDDFRYAMEVNVVAPLALTQALVPRLAQCSRGGRVLHLGWAL